MFLFLPSSLSNYKSINSERIKKGLFKNVITKISLNDFKETIHLQKFIGCPEHHFSGHNQQQKCV